MLEDGEIATICSENTTASDVSSQLISNANQKGGHDNSTVTILHTLSASHSIDNPLASAIKRDLNERKAPKSNLLKLIVLILLIGGTLGALYTSFKDDLNLEVLSGDSSEEFVVLVSDLSLKEITLSVGDTVFFEKMPGTLQVVIDLAELRSVTTLDTNAFENQISRQFYVLDGSEEKSDEDDSEEEVDEEVANSNIKEESPDIESRESKASESEEAETVTSENWRIQLSSNDIRREKSEVFYDLDADEISVLRQGNKWVYYYGCFDSKKEAQAWIDAHPRYSKNGQKPVKNISCDIADDELENSDEMKEVKKDQIKSRKDQPTKIIPKDDGDNQLESDQETKPTEEVISAQEEEKQEDLKPDSKVEKPDSSNTKGDKNI